VVLSFTVERQRVGIPTQHPPWLKQEQMKN
jgi:hypothetical protein